MDLKQPVSHIFSGANRRIGWRGLYRCANCDSPMISRSAINGGYTLGIALIFFLQEY
jgi:hypothetical protein